MKTTFDKAFDFYTEHHPGFTDEQMHIVRTWCRAIAADERREGNRIGVNAGRQTMLSEAIDDIQTMHDELRTAFYPEKSILISAIERLKKLPTTE